LRLQEYERVVQAEQKNTLRQVVELLEDDYSLAHDVKSWSALGRECTKGCRGCAIWQELKEEK